METLKEAIEKISEYLRFPVWKIGAFIGILFLSFLLRKIFALSVVKTITLIARRTETKIDDILVKALSGPASSVFILIGIWLGIKVLGIDGDFLKKILWTFGLFFLGWALYNIVKEFEPYVKDFSKRFGEEFAHEIGNFIVKFLRIFIVIVILLSILERWGINVSAIIASLGIGGLAVALAAKDTFSNMISGLIILLDKPFRVGETIKVGNIIGTVEEIGLRATRIRTFDKSLVTIPNQNLTNSDIENWTRRELRRVRTYIGVVYSTKRDQMEKILQDIRKMLEEHPMVSKDEKIIVNFEEFGESSLQILIQFYINTNEYDKYLSVREEINLKIMEIVEKNGSSFAFPSRSIYLENLPKNLAQIPVKEDKEKTKE